MSGSFQKSGSRPDPASDARPEESAPGAAKDFCQGLEEHLKARAELLGLETREAGELLARKAVLAIAAVALAFFAYALLLVAAVSLLGRWLDSTWPGGAGWQWAALFTALLHLVLACLLFSKLKRKPVAQLFEFTRAEFRKDRQWLKPTNHPPGSESDSSP